MIDQLEQNLAETKTKKKEKNQRKRKREEKIEKLASFEVQRVQLLGSNKKFQEREREREKGMQEGETYLTY